MAQSLLQLYIGLTKEGSEASIGEIMSHLDTVPMQPAPIPADMPLCAGHMGYNVAEVACAKCRMLKGPY